jgi:hypothetical protein
MPDPEDIDVHSNITLDNGKSKENFDYVPQQWSCDSCRQGVMVTVVAIISETIVPIALWFVVLPSIYGIHLLNKIYSWKNKHMWEYHTTLGRRGEPAEIKKLYLSTGF